MLLPINKIVIKNRVRKDYGDLESLAESIKKHGLMHDIVVAENTYELLAGERRLKALQLIGCQQVQVKLISVADAESSHNIELEENLLRKDFTREEAVNWGVEMERIERAKAEGRHGTRTDLQKNFTGSCKFGQVRDFVGKKLRMSGVQYEREKLIVSKKDIIDPKEYSDWNNRLISTNKIYTEYLQPKTEKIVKVKEEPDDYVKIKEENTSFKNQIAELSAKIESLEKDTEDLRTKNTNLTNQLENSEATPTTLPFVADTSEVETYKNTITSLENSIAEKDKHIDHLENEVKTLSNISFLEGNKTEIYRAAEETDEIYDLAQKVRQILENDLAPLKFRRCFERVPLSEVARENLADLIENVELWCREMMSELGKNDTVIIDA